MKDIELDEETWKKVAELSALGVILLISFTASFYGDPDNRGPLYYNVSNTTVDTVNAAETTAEDGYRELTYSANEISRSVNNRITSFYEFFYSRIRDQRAYNRSGRNPDIARSPPGEIEKIYRSDLNVARSPFGQPYTRIKTNSRGLREDEFDEKPPENTTRILVIGDSYVFGIGVNASDRYTDVLEEKLNKRKEGDYQVINAGISGTGLKDYYLFLKNQGLDYNPDIVVVSVIGNDWMSVNLQDRISRKAKNEVRTNYSDISRERENELISKRFLDLQVENKNLSRYSLIENITALTESRDIDTIIYASDYMHSSKMAWITNYTETGENRLVLAPQEFRDDWKSPLCLKYSPNRVSTIDPHPSAEGHEMLADRLYSEITGTEESIAPWSYGGLSQWIDPC